MAVKATPLSGWEDYTPPIKGNDGTDAVRCQVRPLLPELEANLGITRALTVDMQRQILTNCCRNIVNYEGTNGQPCETPLDLIRFGGREAARFIGNIVDHVVGMSWTGADKGESDAPSA